MHGMPACELSYNNQPFLSAAHTSQIPLVQGVVKANLLIHGGVFDQHATAGWGVGRSNSLKVRFGIETSLNGAEASSYRAS